MGNSQRRPKGRHRPKSATGTLSFSASCFHSVCPSGLPVCVGAVCIPPFTPFAPSSHATRSSIHPRMLSLHVSHSGVHASFFHSSLHLFACQPRVAMRSISRSASRLRVSHPSLPLFLPSVSHTHAQLVMYLLVALLLLCSICCLRARIPHFSASQVVSRHVPLFSPLH